MLRGCCLVSGCGAGREVGRDLLSKGLDRVWEGWREMGREGLSPTFCGAVSRKGSEGENKG